MNTVLTIGFYDYRAKHSNVLVIAAINLLTKYHTSILIFHRNGIIPGEYARSAKVP